MSMTLLGREGHQPGAEAMSEPELAQMCLCDVPVTDDT